MTYMLTIDEQDIANEWKKYQGYTVRPQPSTVSYYERIINHYPGQPACLMYGGTPEIRQIFQRRQLPIDILDRDPAVIRALGYLTDSAAPIAANENVIIADWLATDHPTSRQYDFILGDDAINMVRWNQFDRFLKNTWMRLNENGSFICHLLVQPDDHYINQSVDMLKLGYKTGRIKSPYDLASRLNFICYDRTSYAMGWQRTIAHIGRHKLDEFKPSFDFVSLFGKCNSQFYCPPKKLFEQCAEQYFTIKEIFYSNEHDFCHFEPVYYFQKRMH